MKKFESHCSLSFKNLSLPVYYDKFVYNHKTKNILKTNVVQTKLFFSLACLSYKYQQEYTVIQNEEKIPAN